MPTLAGCALSGVGHGGGRAVNTKELISHSQFAFPETPMAHTYDLASLGSSFADGFAANHPGAFMPTSLFLKVSCGINSLRPAAPRCFTVRLSGFVAVRELASVTCTVKLVVPVPVGVPEITPVLEVSTSPVGRVPTVIDQLQGFIPPVTASVIVPVEGFPPTTDVGFGLTLDSN